MYIIKCEFYIKSTSPGVSVLRDAPALQWLIEEMVD